jgi:fructose/tagatose bisphosphate aldolase
MPLVSMSGLLAHAARSGYAVCYSESWDLPSLQAVVEAAEECSAPFIAGFNGGFLRHSGRARPESLAFYAGFRVALERTAVPAVFLLNESDDFGQMREAMDLGFNAVMPENEGLSPEAYTRMVTDVVAAARPRGVSVEAQLGVLPAGDGHAAGSRTDPVAARAFAAETGIDALAVSVGNIHILTEGHSPLDFDTLARLRDAVPVPLVLHGGTGLPPESIETVIRLGVAKLNYGTLLKQAYLEALRAALSCYAAPMSPHEFLGMGGERDILTAGREAVKAKAKWLLSLSGSAGRASEALAAL